MEDEPTYGKKKSRSVMIFLLLGLFIGFLFGFLLHDTLVEHNPIDRDIKSWYPR